MTLCQDCSEFGVKAKIKIKLVNIEKGCLLDKPGQNENQSRSRKDAVSPRQCCVPLLESAACRQHTTEDGSEQSCGQAQTEVAGTGMGYVGRGAQRGAKPEAENSNCIECSTESQGKVGVRSVALPCSRKERDDEEDEECGGQDSEQKMHICDVDMEGRGTNDAEGTYGHATFDQSPPQSSALQPPEKCDACGA